MANRVPRSSLGRSDLRDHTWLSQRFGAQSCAGKSLFVLWPRSCASVDAPRCHFHSPARADRFSQMGDFVVVRDVFFYESTSSI